MFAYSILQYISAWWSRIRILFHRCTKNYGYFSFTFCFWSQWLVLSATIPPAAKLDYSKHKHFRRLVSLASVPDWKMDQSETKPHDVSERYSRMWDNNCLLRNEMLTRSRRIFHPKNKPSERDSNSHCCFHPPAQSDQAALWRIL